MVMHHTHSGGISGPRLGADDFLREGTLSQAIGKLRLDAAREGSSYVDNCFVEPTATWTCPAQLMGIMRILEAKADGSYANACFVTT